MRKKDFGGKLVKSVILWAMTMMLTFSPVFSSIGTLTLYAEEVEHHDESKSEDKHESKVSESSSEAKASESHESHAESSANTADSKAGEAKSEASAAETKADEAKSASDAVKEDQKAAEKAEECAKSLQSDSESAVEGVSEAVESAEKTVEDKNTEIANRIAEAEDKAAAISEADEEGKNLIEKDVEAAQATVAEAENEAAEAKKNAEEALKTILENDYDSEKGNHDAAAAAYETIHEANEKASDAVTAAKNAVEQANRTVEAAENALNALQEDASAVEQMEEEQQTAIDEAQKILDAAKEKMEAAQNAYKASMSDRVAVAEAELQAAEALSDEVVDKQDKVDAAMAKLEAARAEVIIQAAADVAKDADEKNQAAQDASEAAKAAKEKSVKAAEEADEAAEAAKDDYAFVKDGKTYADLEKQAKAANEAVVVKSADYSSTVEAGKAAVEAAQKAYDDSVEATTAKAVEAWEAEIANKKDVLAAKQSVLDAKQAEVDRIQNIIDDLKWYEKIELAYWGPALLVAEGQRDDAEEERDDANDALMSYSTNENKQSIINSFLIYSDENKALTEAKKAEADNNKAAKDALDSAVKTQETENAKLAYIFSRAGETLTKETMEENLTEEEQAELNRINRELTASMTLYKETIKDAEKYDDSTSDLRSFNLFDGDWWKELGKAFEFWTVAEKRNFENKYSAVAGTGHFFENLDFETAKKNTNALYNYANKLCVAANIDEMELDVFYATYNAALADKNANAASVAAEAAANYAKEATDAKKAVDTAIEGEKAALEAYEAAKREYTEAKRILDGLKANATKVDAQKLEDAQEAVENARKARNVANKNYEEAAANLAVARSCEAWLKDLANPDDGIKALVFGYKGSGDAVQTKNPENVDSYDSVVKSQDVQNYTAGGELGDDVQVPYAVMHEFVKFMYENINKDHATAMTQTGKGIALQRQGSTEEATLPVVYWDVDEEGKLTGTFHVGTDASMESGRYYVAYTFKHEGDGYHFDGVYVEYTKPERPVGEGSSEPDGKHSHKVTAAVAAANAVTIIDEETPLVATIEDEESPLSIVIPDEFTPIADAPQTGDDTIPVLPVAMAGTVAIGAAILLGKKKEEK